MITGIVVAGIGIAIPALGGGGAVGVLQASGWLVVLAVLVFAVGEMMASPTSQEYIGSIAPKDKVALYMGYYFIAVALGNLFGNVLGGIVYGKLARDLGRPDLMWLVFSGMALVTAVALALYNRYAVPKPASQSTTAKA
jgi:dipeptide/tripeptide permease